MRRNFDDQANSFDQRAGLPEPACEAIARELVSLVRPEPADLLLEAGAGTGQIGHYLCAMPLGYIGFDSSKAMLEVFERRCRASGRSAALIHADGNGRWPADDGLVKAVFSSRAIHLLSSEHVVEEVFRVASPKGAVLIVGRVQRAKESLRSRLRRELHERLRHLGYSPSEGQQQERRILEACCARGAALFQPRIAATWPAPHGAAMVIKSWREKSGLAGLAVPAQVKQEMLMQLGSWAAEIFGSLQAVQEAEEKYVLEGAWLRAE
jgi:ubiquinone/menaquinone biosynthesis C-methylase UbiE